MARKDVETKGAFSGGGGNPNPNSQIHKTALCLDSLDQIQIHYLSEFSERI